VFGRGFFLARALARSAAAPFPTRRHFGSGCKSTIPLINQSASSIGWSKIVQILTAAAADAAAACSKPGWVNSCRVCHLHLRQATQACA